MRRRGASLLMLSLIVASGVLAALPAGWQSSAASAQPRSLSLTPLPPNLPTSSSGASKFQALVVSVTDLKGDPLVLPNATTVYLSSSESAVLSVQPTVTIPAGAQYALAYVYTTATPGNSTVTAVSPGFDSASTVFETSIARGYPTELRVFPLPGSFPAGTPSVATYAVAVVDAAGLPARTVQATDVSVTSSDTSILTVGEATIPLNQTIGYGSMSTTGLAGTAAMTASASGLVSSSAVVSVISNSTAPVELSLTSPPTSLPANGGTYNVLTVTLLDNQSRPAVAKSLVQVFLTSSRTDIATTPDVVNIPAGESSANIPVSTSSASGSTFITASAPNFVSSSAEISAVSIPPTHLGMYLADGNGIIAKNSNRVSLVVQLQDSQGVPAEARTPANVIISFSNSSLVQTPITLTIPKGSDLAYTNVTLANATTGTFSAISNGLSSAYAKFAAQPLAVADSFIANPPTVQLGQTTSIVFTLKSQGNPVGGAALAWTSVGGSVSAGTKVTDSSGTWTAAFTPDTAGLATVTITADSPLMGPLNATVYVTVLAIQVKQNQSIVQELVTFPYVLIPVAVAAAAAVMAFLFIRRRRRGKEADGALSDEEQGFSFLGRDLGLRRPAWLPARGVAG
jgi:hypothetical protein